MKTAQIIVLLAILSHLIASTDSLFGEDLKTLDGAVYKNATITTVTPAYVTVMHDEGVAHVLLQNLPPELQTKYGYDREKAAKFAAADAEAQRQIARQQLSQQQQVTREQSAQQRELAGSVAKDKIIQAIEGSELRIRLTNINQITDGGVLMGGMNASDVNGRFVASAGDWYLVGYNTSGAVDGAEIFGLTVFAAGTYRYLTAGGASRTVPRYATTPELAFKLLLEDEIRKKRND